MPPEDNRTEYDMMFICNIMDYKRHDEVIIMLLFTIIKQGQSMAHLCLLKVLLFMLAGSCKRSNVAQWSLHDLSAIARAHLLPSDLQPYKEVRE